MNVSIYVTCYRWTENRKHYNIELLGSSFESYPSKVTKSFIINCQLIDADVCHWSSEGERSVWTDAVRRTLKEDQD